MFLPKVNLLVISVNLILLVNSVHGLFETCNKTVAVPATGTVTVSNPGYPSRYPSGSSCIYRITAPSGYVINAQCKIKLDAMTNNQCNSEYFFMALDGNKTLTNAEYFCGNGELIRRSIFNQMAIAYTSGTPRAGDFTCVLSAIESCDCGWSVNTKIVGGTPAEVNQFPSMVSLRDSGTHLCGATIISSRYLITAAHCVDAFSSLTNIKARVGEHDTRTGNESPYTADYNVVNAIKHPSYNADTGANDIAIILVDKDIQFSRGVGPACLPDPYSHTTFDTQTLTAAGWGTTSYGGPTSRTLLKAGLQVVSNADCATRTGSAVAATKLCTYSKGKDTCQMDSGGPLYYTENRQYIIGIVSQGVACATTRPSINTRVTSYLDWIKTTTNAKFCVP